MNGTHKGRIQDKVCIGTGAALGLGEAAARLLAREGGKLVLTDIKDAEGEALAAAIRNAGGQATYMHHDVASELQWESVVARALDTYGRLDVLVNNAGVGIGCPPDEQTLEQWRWLYLACDESKFVTGSALVIDGGYTAQ